MFLLQETFRVNNRTHELDKHRSFSWISGPKTFLYNLTPLNSDYNTPQYNAMNCLHILKQYPMYEIPQYISASFQNLVVSKPLRLTDFLNPTNDLYDS